MLEQFFAKRLLKDNYTEDRAQFLCSLMQTSRQGHLCWKTGVTPLMPPGILEEGKDLSVKTPVVRDGDRYYLNRNWVYETHILVEVKRLKATKPALHNEEAFYQELEKTPLNPIQRDVCTHAFQNAFALICGGPGTGKTFTASHLVKLLVNSRTKKKYKVSLAAPTGKAASHLQSVLLSNGPLDADVQSTTLHRLLRLNPGESPLFNNRKIDADLVLVDEASMIDVPLLTELLKSVGNETKLILMGDPDQLPPVETGSLFAEMADLFGCRLQTSMRTNVSQLHSIAASINRGEFPDLADHMPWTFDETLAIRLYDAIQPIVSWQEPKIEECFQHLNQFRVLGALRQGPFGIDAINNQIIREMDRHIKAGQWWAVPIMITNNVPNLDLYNGTCGILVGKSRSGGINFREGTAYFPQEIPFKRLPYFEVAFCLSIHKSQGSEFNRVLILFPIGSENFGREAVYTAVTRAKEKVEIVGEESTLRAMLSQRSRRTSGFTERFT